MQRDGTGDHGVETIGARRRCIVDQRGAAFDQSRGRRNRQRRANDRRLGGRVGTGGDGGQGSDGNYRGGGKRQGK